SGPGLVPMAEAPRENTGWGSIVLRQPGNHPYYVQVESVSNVLARLGVKKLDLMVLDVEGYELPVLDGMGAVRPQLIVLEVHPIVLEQIGAKPEAYYDAVQRLGYECFDLHGILSKP